MQQALRAVEKRTGRNVPMRRIVNGALRGADGDMLKYLKEQLLADVQALQKENEKLSKENNELLKSVPKRVCTPVTGCGKQSQRTELEAMLPGKCLNFAGEGGFSCVFHDGEVTAYKTARDDEEDTQYEKLKDTPGVLAMQLHTVEYTNEKNTTTKGKYYSGEMCMHGDLEEYSKNATAEDLARVLKQVIPAFQSLHGAGFLHGDVKPQNMVVCADLTLKLIDYSGSSIPASLVGEEEFSTRQRTGQYSGLVTSVRNTILEHIMLWGDNSIATALVEECTKKTEVIREMVDAMEPEEDTMVFVSKDEIKFTTNKGLRLLKNKLKEIDKYGVKKKKSITDRFNWFNTANQLQETEIQQLIDSHNVRLGEIKTEIDAIKTKISVERVKFAFTINDVRSAHYAIVLCIYNFYGIRLKEKSDEGNETFRRIQNTLGMGVAFLAYNLELVGWLALAKLKHIPKESMHPALYALMQNSLKEIVRKPDLFIPDWPFTDDGEIAEAVVKRKIGRYSEEKTKKIYNEEYMTPLSMVEFEVTQNKPSPTAEQMAELRQKLGYANQKIAELNRE